MLAKRIIPCLDVNQGRVVKGQQFKKLKDVADPAELALRYSNEGADELVFYDITASSDVRKISHTFVKDVADQINIPFCVGGGISSLEDMTFILRQGADKVSINTAAVLNPSLIQEGALKFGAQCMVLSIDAKKEGDTYYVYTHGGRQKTSLKVIDWVLQGIELGAGEIVLNTIDTDGELSGYDTELIQTVSSLVNVPVIASGGAGTVDHFIDAAMAGAEGLLAASVFHFETLQIKEVKDALFEKGIPVRR
jgi:cyclase